MSIPFSHHILISPSHQPRRHLLPQLPNQTNRLLPFMTHIITRTQECKRRRISMLLLIFSHKQCNLTPPFPCIILLLPLEFVTPFPTWLFPTTYTSFDAL